MKKPRTGGRSGLLRVPFWGTVMAREVPSHYLLTPFTGSLSQAFCLRTGAEIEEAQAKRVIHCFGISLPVVGFRRSG